MFLISHNWNILRTVGIQSIFCRQFFKNLPLICIFIMVMPSLFVCIFYRQILVTFTWYLCLWYAYIGSHSIGICTIQIQLEGILQRMYLKYKCHPPPLPQIICFNAIKIKFNNFLETKSHLYFEFLLFSLLSFNHVVG